MFLCIDNGNLYVTNAPESDLKLCLKRNKNFHYEPIYYAPCDSVKPHKVELDPVEVERKARTPRRLRNYVSPADIDKALDEMFAAEDLELAL